MAEKVAAINRVTAREGEIPISSDHKSNSILSLSSLTERKQIMTTATLDIKVLRVQKVKGNSSLKAYVDISISDLITIKNFKVIDAGNGLFVGKPSEKSKTEKKWFQTVRCANKEVEEDLDRTILAAYSKE